ncbi:MAG: glucose-1-phosphate adenylyltransferase [Candidatus Omnitrophica bacterium]|nr:glucose-1-phosphate adenylyltransferase [Candidatus Omnitrophota bacterium]MCM8817137.1 glucose-1-phosphate adenylyltransferase [Candidatus Omnitrophota bacterium]
MADRILTLVLAGGKGERLYPLTKDRAKPAVPFGGIYRIIDFTLSNAINSGLRKIYVLIQYKSYSLQRHIREGWNIFSRELGEFIDVIPAQMRIGTDWYLGTADSVFQNIYFLNQEKPDMVLILSGDHVYKMDYRRMIQFHKEKKADLTISVFEEAVHEAKRFGVLQINENHEVINFVEKPKDPIPAPYNPSVSLVSMGIYLFNTETLVRRLFEDARKTESTHDFGKDVIPSMIGKDKVFAFPFIDENRKETKYWKDIGTIEAYYEANMDLVSVEPVLNLYDSDWPIRTFQEQLPPAKTVFSYVERTGMILDSIMGGGCIISGGKVYRSVLSPWVRVNSYAEVSESILMDNVNVGRYCKIKRAIIDKNVVIPQGTMIGYDIAEDKKRFVVSDTGIVVIPKDYQW